MDAALTPAEICRLLATGERLRVVAALVLGADSAEDVGARTGLGALEVTAALARLTAGGLVERGPDGRLRLRAETIEAAARTSAEASEHADYAGADPDEAAVLRAFMPAGWWPCPRHSRSGGSSSTTWRRRSSRAAATPSARSTRSWARSANRPTGPGRSGASSPPTT
jgi:hypothetical protein